MEQDMGSALVQEKRAAALYDSIRTTKEAEITVAKQQIMDKNTELADTKVSLANAKQDKEDTQASLSADERFLLDMRQKCASWDKNYDERTKTRHEEIEAINEAIKILTDDEARDLFGKTVNKPVSFLQISVTDRRQKAV